MWLCSAPGSLNSTLFTALESSQCGRGQSTNKFRSVKPAHLIQGSIPHHDKAVISCQPPSRRRLPEPGLSSLHHMLQVHPGSRGLCGLEYGKRGRAGQREPMEMRFYPANAVQRGSEHRALRTEKTQVSFPPLPVTLSLFLGISLHSFRFLTCTWGQYYVPHRVVVKIKSDNAHVALGNYY